MDEDKCAVDKRLAMTRTALERTEAAVEEVEAEDVEDEVELIAGASRGRCCSSPDDFFSAVTVGGGVNILFFSVSRSTASCLA